MPSRSISQLTSTAVGVRRASGIPVGIPGLGFGVEPPTPQAPIIASVTISGGTLVGSVLSSSISYTQVPVPSATPTYQWDRDGSPISGATSASYTLVEADAGAAITLDVSVTNSEGSDSDTSNTINAAALAAPSITGVPTISGTLYEGNTLTATAASVTGNPPPATTWQWERDGTPISGATAATYTLVSADGNTDITVVQTETNSQGSDTAESAASTIEAAPVISGVPTIAGTEEVGQTLTATAASVTGTPTPTRTWQWQRSADGSTGWADISGATASTYTLVSADEDEYVRAVQTETNANGTDSAESAASGQISGALPLDTVTSAVLAFSTARKLRTAYTGDAIRVRRSSDNAEQDIGFDGSGNLDESALTTFVGANDGFITKIYGQVGAIDLAQSTAANQPQIVSSGSVIKQGGKPAADFGGLGNPSTGVGNLRYMDATSASTLSQPNTVFLAHEFLSAASTQALFDCGTGDRNSVAATSTYLLFSGSVANSGIATDTAAHVVTALFNGASSQIWVDNAGSGAISAGADGLGTFRVGANLTPGFSLSGTLPEIIVCDADESGATRSALEANLAAYYGITLA